MTDANSPIAGWYPDPEDPAGERWWNGTGWSDHRRGGTPGFAPVADQGEAPPPPPTAARTAAPTATPTSRYSTNYATTSSTVARPMARFNTMAVAGLVISLSTFIMPLFGINGIVGAVFGFIGLRDARRREQAGLTGTGRGTAIGAIVSGIVLTLLVWAVIVGFIVFIVWITTLPYDYVT